MVFHTNLSNWETAPQSTWSLDQDLWPATEFSALRIMFSETAQCLTFITWFSKMVSRPAKHVDVGNGHVDCKICPLSFKSLKAARLHQPYHEGAYVDIFGCCLGNLQNDFLDQLFDTVVVRELDLEFMVHSIEFKCGSSLSDDSSWGCKKLFIGLFSFTEHLKSAVGKICWAPLREYSPTDSLTSTTLERGNYTFSQVLSEVSCLPERLFFLYPALERVDWAQWRLLFTSDVNSRHWPTLGLEQPCIPEPGLIERRPLSTIASEVTARTQLTGRSSASRMSTNSLLNSGRIQRNLAFTSAKEFLAANTASDTQADSSAVMLIAKSEQV